MDLLTALVNSWANLVKLRPHMVPYMIGTFKQWTPASLAGQSALGIRSVEKCIRILLVNILRYVIVSKNHELVSDSIQIAR